MKFNGDINQVFMTDALQPSAPAPQPPPPAARTPPPKPTAVDMALIGEGGPTGSFFKDGVPYLEDTLVPC